MSTLMHGQLSALDLLEPVAAPAREGVDLYLAKIDVGFAVKQIRDEFNAWLGPYLLEHRAFRYSLDPAKYPEEFAEEMPLRGGMMLDVLDPDQIIKHGKAWGTVNPWPDRARFYGFRKPSYYLITDDGTAHEHAIFTSDVRCVCWIGYKGEPRVHGCSCVGDYYHRAYCYGCRWWSEIMLTEKEAKAEYAAHAELNLQAIP